MPAFQTGNFGFQGVGQFGFQDDSGTPAPVVQPQFSGGFPDFGTAGERRRLRERFELTDKAEEVIESVAKHQAQDLHLDDQQRLEEFTRELELEGIEFQGRYLEALNVMRQGLIDAEIKRFFDAQADEDALAMLLLIAASI